MRFLILIITLLASTSTFTQHIDTSFIITTQQSEIRITCQKTFENDKVSQSIQSLSVFIRINQNATDEALNTGIEKDECIASLNYDNECNLISMTMFKPSQNIRFNQQIEAYFNEFIDAYNTHNLKLYFSESETDCGIQKLRISYRIL